MSPLRYTAPFFWEFHAFAYLLPHYSKKEGEVGEVSVIILVLQMEKWRCHAGVPPAHIGKPSLTFSWVFPADDAERRQGKTFQET